MRIGVLKYLSGIFIFLFVSAAQAQEAPIDNDLEKKYTPNSTSVFNTLFRKPENGNGRSDISVNVKNSIKFNATALFRQKFLLWYERELFSGFTLNIGVGKPFGKDFMQSLYIQTFSLVKNNESGYMTAGNVQEYSDYAGSSLTFAIAPRFYFEDSFEEGYIEFVYSYERINFRLKELSIDYPVVGFRSASFKMNSFGINWGYAWLSGRRENFTNEFYFGVGIKFFNYTAFREYDNTYNSPTYNSSISAPSYYMKSDHTLNMKLYPTMCFGYSFGFGF